MTLVPTIDMTEAAALATTETTTANEYLEHIGQMELSNPTDLRFAVGVVAEMKDKHKAVDMQRRKFTDVAQAIIDEANTFFKPALKSLAECEKVLKKKIVEYDTRQVSQRAQLIAQAGQAGMEGASAAASTLMTAADACINPKIPGLSMRRSTKIDIHDASTAVQWCVDNGRLELLQLNEKAIKALAKAANGQGVAVPGITVIPSATVAITVSDVERG